MIAASNLVKSILTEAVEVKALQGVCLRSRSVRSSHSSSLGKRQDDASASVSLRDLVRVRVETMADGSNKVGFLKWFAGGAASALSGFSVMTVVIALTVVYVVVHYRFASLTADTTALLPLLLTAAIAVPEMLVKLISLHSVTRSV